MQPEYNPLQAAAVAHAHLPEYFRAALTQDDVFNILHLEFMYQQTIGLTDEALLDPARPVVLDTEQLVIYIREQARLRGYMYTAEQIAHVLKAEDVYLRQIGVID